MAMLYVFPASIYNPGYVPAELDEIEIEEPYGPTATKSAGSPSQARFTLYVNSYVLHDIVATITFTRIQTNLNTPSAVSSNGAVWTYTNNDATTPVYEAKWSRSQINVGTTTEFSINFNVGGTPGTYLVTFRIKSAELTLAAQCEIQHTVTP